MLMCTVGFGRYGPPEVLEPLKLPRPELKDDTVLVRVAAAGINPADWRFRSGQFRFFTQLPFVPGSDVAGVVEAIGSAVTRFRPGDAVFAMLPTTQGGGYAEFAAVREGEAAAVPLAGLTALQALRDKAGVQPGARVLIYGASGGVGTFAVQIAKALGAHVTGVSSGRNADFVRGLGADGVLDYTRTDLTTVGDDYDVVFDTVNKLPFRRGRRVLRRGGVMVTVNPVADKLAPDLFAPLRGGRRLRSVLVRPSGRDLGALAAWLAADRVRPVIDTAYPLAEVAAAHRYSETERVRGKLVLRVNEGLVWSADGAQQERVATSALAGTV